MTTFTPVQLYKSWLAALVWFQNLNWIRRFTRSLSA